MFVFVLVQQSYYLELNLRIILSGKRQTAEDVHHSGIYSNKKQKKTDMSNNIGFVK